MKLLFIACYSPLINNSAAIETLQYLNKLCDIEGNEIHLLTVNFPENSVYYDKTLLNMMDKRIKLHAIEGGFVFKKLMPRKHNTSGNAFVGKSSGSLKKILRKIKNAVVIPDMYYGWAKKAAKYGVNLIEKENIDTVFSMHEPPSSHLCAYYIKKQIKNIPWITYWSDPWLKDSTRENSFFVKKIIEKRMEKNIVSLSDRFIFVTDDNRNEYLKDYPNIKKDNTYILNRGFDAQLYDKLKKEEVPEHIKKDKINIIYTGEIFSKLRNIKPFIKALEEIKKEDAAAFSKLNVLFFGNIDDIEAKKKLKNLECADAFPRIPFNEALKYMLNGDILLLFGNKNSKQIPAKIYDYFGAEGRIFVIYGDSNDPIKRICAKHEKCISCDNDAEKIKNDILNMVRMYDNNKLKCSRDNNYEWDAIAGRLCSILKGA